MTQKTRQTRRGAPMFRVTLNAEEVEPKELLVALANGDTVGMHWCHPIDVEVTVGV